MIYQFDMSRMTLGDYVDMQHGNSLDIALKCSITDIHEIPLSDLTLFIESFGAAFAKHAEIQFPPINPKDK